MDEKEEKAVNKNEELKDTGTDESAKSGKEEKSKQIVKSMKLLEGVYKTSPDATQKNRVKKEINKLKKMLKDMYPNTNIDELEEAIYAELMTAKSIHETSQDFNHYQYIKDVQINNYSPYKDDYEVNEAASIMVHFEDKIWGILSDQHTKLDFSNSSERDTLYRKLDQCNRSFKLFGQTIEDIEKTKSPEYISQLHMMRAKQARVFLFSLHDFLITARDFISNIIADAEFGGTMVLNPEDKIEYAEYEKYTTFENWTVIDSLKYIKKFIDESLTIIKVPGIDKSQK